MRNVDVAVRYAISTSDKGLRQAVSLTKDYAVVTKDTTRQVDMALRATNAAWRDTARVAASAQRQVSQESIASATRVSRSVTTTVADLRRAGVGYKEIAVAAKGWGVTAQETAAAIERSAAKEIAAIDRVAAARNKMRGMVGLSTSSGGRGAGSSSRESQGLERGLVGGVSSKVKYGASMVGGGLIGGLAGYIGVSGLKSAIAQTMSLAKETQFLTQVTGMDSKTAAEWAAVAQSRDISTRTLNVSLKTLATGAGAVLTGVSKASASTMQTLSAKSAEAIKGTKGEVAAFKELGISTNDVAKHQHNLGDLYDLVTARLAKMRDGVQKTATSNLLLGKSATASQQAAMAFKDLGISEAQLKAHSGDLSGLMDLVATKLEKVRGGAEKTRIEAALFGKGFQQLTPMITGGAKALEAERKQAAAYGVTLGGSAAQNVQKLREASESLKLAQIGLEVQFAEHVAPAMIKVTEDGIKLFGVLRKDLGPAVHFVGDEVKDVTHWLGEHQTVLHALEGTVIAVAGAYTGLKVIKGAVTLVRGITSDMRTAGAVAKALGSPLSSIKGLFGTQESESAALAKSQNALAEANARLAASFDAVAASAKAAGPSEAVADVGAAAPGAGLVLPAGARSVEQAAPEASEVETASLAQNAEQGGLMAMMFGKQQMSGIMSKVAPVLTTAAKAGMFGLIGNQLGGLAGGLIGGKTGAGYGSAIGTGAGIGMAIGPEGAAVGAGVGALVHFLSGLSGPSPSDALKSLTAEMRKAADAGNSTKLKQLAAQADKLGGSFKNLPGDIMSGDQKYRAQFAKLGNVADQTATALGRVRERQQTQLGRQAAAPLEQAIGASKTGATAGQIDQATVRQLQTLAPAAKLAGAKAMVQFTAGLEANRKLPVGSTDKLITDLEHQYPALSAYLSKAGATSMQAIADKIQVNKVRSNAQALIDSLHKTFGFLPTYADTAGESTKQKMQSAMDELRQIVATGTAQQAAAAKPALAQLEATYSKYTSLIKQQTIASLTAAGNSVSSFARGWARLGGTVHTVAGTVDSSAASLSTYLQHLSSAGLAGIQRAGKREGGYFSGVVPGDHTQDGTLAWLSGREFVMTGSGQGMMEAYAPGLLGHIAASQAPHYAGGGYVVKGPVSTFGPPGEAAGGTAYGFSSSQAGIAVNPDGGSNWNDTLAQALGRQWANVNVQGHQARLQVIDKGPSASGSHGARKIDITGAGVAKLGIPYSSFQTDAIGSATFGGGVNTTTTGSGSRDLTVTRYEQAGKGLPTARGAAFDLGYQYGLDPTSGTGPGAALRAAAAGASLKAVKQTVSLPKKSSTSNLTASAARVQQSMTRASSRVLGLPYTWGGGHNSSFAPTPGLDCSGLDSYMLHAAGLLSSPLTAQQFMSWGLPGNGKYITVAAQPDHTMMEFFGKFIESGGRTTRGPHWDSTWSYPFPAHRHPAGFRKGGMIAGRRGDFGRQPPASLLRTAPWLASQAPFKAYAQKWPNFRAGGHAGGHRTKTSRPAIQVSAGRSGSPASSTGGGVPSSLRYKQLQTVAGAIASIPVQAVDIGTRTGQKVLAELNRSLNVIASSSNDRKVKQAMSSLQGALSNVPKLSYTTLEHTATALNRQIFNLTHTAHKHRVRVLETTEKTVLGPHGHARLVKHQQLVHRTVTTYTPKTNLSSGEKHQAARLKQALALTDYQMGKRAGMLVTAAENQADALTAGQQRLQNLMTRKGIDAASAQGEKMLVAYDKQAQKVLHNTVAKLEKAYALAKKSGDSKAAADISSKLQDAIGQLDDAVTQTISDKRDQVAAAAQQVVDSATHGVTMAEGGLSNLETEQQIAKTSGTPGAAGQLAAYVQQTVLPAIQDEIAALTKQQQTALKAGNTELADQIGEAIQQANGDYLQQIADSNQAIQDATEQTAENTDDLQGTLGVTMNNATFADLGGILNAV